MVIEVYSASKYPSSIVHILSAETQSEKLPPLFVWIPGNPGLLEYYEELLELIHKKHPEWEILGISHAGMSSGNPLLEGNDHTIYSLEDQIDHKIDVINSFSSKERPLIIMGHSVGCFMAQRVILSKHLVGEVKHMGLLMPTVIDIHLSKKGIFMTRVLDWVKYFPYYLGWVSQMIFYTILPLSVVKFIISKAMTLMIDSKAVHATQVLLRNSKFIQQALGLAKYEMLVIRDDWEFQRQLANFCNEKGVKSWVLFANNDHWVSNHTRSKLIEFYKDNCNNEDLKIYLTDKVPHAFVVKSSQHVVDEYF